MTEQEMVGWHHRLSGHEFEHSPGDSEGQGSLACCCPRSHKKLYMAEQPNHNILTCECRTTRRRNLII